MLTWLNGRIVGGIMIGHNGSTEVLWAVTDGTSIEDMLQAFVKRKKINVRAEIETGE